MAPVHRVSDMDIDEVSLVDRPANPFASVVIAKRAQEDAVAEEYFDADGAPIDAETLEVGDVIADADGELFVYDPNNEIDVEALVAELTDGEDGQYQDEGELATVGKSAFFTEPSGVSDSALSGIRAELSKALNAGNQEILSKALDAFEAIEKRAAEADRRSVRLEQIAKREREIRLEREYIAKAAEYNVPVEAEQLGPVLMRMAETLPYEDCAVIHKALTAAGEMLFTEAGYAGQERDPLDELEAEIDASVSKSGKDDVSKAQASTGFFDDNPDAYERYRAERQNR